MAAPTRYTKTVVKSFALGAFIEYWIAWGMMRYTAAQYDHPPQEYLRTFLTPFQLLSLTDQDFLTPAIAFFVTAGVLISGIAITTKLMMDKSLPDNVRALRPRSARISSKKAA